MTKYHQITAPSVNFIFFIMSSVGGEKLEDSSKEVQGNLIRSANSGQIYGTADDGASWRIPNDSMP